MIENGKVKANKILKEKTLREVHIKGSIEIMII